MIPVFHDFISLRHLHVGADNQNQFIDSIMQNIDSQKSDKDPSQITGLQATARVTHSGRLTGHWHYYTPKGVDKGTSSFIYPYEKPVLKHHNEDRDAIGRVKTSTYISTPSASIPHSIQDRLNNTLYYDKKSIKDLRKISNILYDKQFEGLGYIQTSANITDEKGIENIVKGIYHTISIGYGTDALVCSECGTDWFADGMCEHEKGQDYGKGPMFLIFGIMDYSEYSYVNKPADNLAANMETSYTRDSIMGLLDKTTSQYERQHIIAAAVGKDSMNINDLGRVAISDMKLHAIDSSDTIYIPNSKNYKITNNHGDNMTSLKKLKESENLYATISEHLGEDKVLSEDKLAELKDSDYVGKRLFPVVDVDHIEAARKVLETVNDSKEKAELLTFLDQREASLKEAADNTDSDESTDSENTDNQDSVEDTNVENKDSDSTEASVETTDEVSYSFQLRASGWGLPDGKTAESDKEKAILELLLSMYAAGKEDALTVINSILEKSGDNKDSIIESLAADKIAEYEDRIDNYKNEQEVWNTTKDNLNSNIADLTTELRDNLVETISSKADKSNPDFNIDELKDKLKAKSLVELKAAVEIDSLIVGKADFVPASEEDSTLNQDDSSTVEELTYTDEDLDSLEAGIESTYIELRRGNQKMADSYRSAQLASVAQKRAKLKEKQEQVNNE